MLALARNHYKSFLRYTLASLAVAWGAVGFFMGLTDAATAMSAIWIGLAALGLRRAVANNSTGQCYEPVRLGDNNYLPALALAGVCDRTIRPRETNRGRHVPFISSSGNPN